MRRGPFYDARARRQDCGSLTRGPLYASPALTTSRMPSARAHGFAPTSSSAMLRPPTSKIRFAGYLQAPVDIVVGAAAGWLRRPCAQAMRGVATERRRGAQEGQARARAGVGRVRVGVGGVA